MKAFFLLLLVIFLVPARLSAQNIDKSLDDEIVYYSEKSLGLKLHTQGYGINYNIGKIKDIYEKTFWQIEFQEIKHPKEGRRQSNIFSQNQTLRNYIFGKKNNFYNLNLVRAKYKTISGRGRKSPVAISYTYKGGLSLGLLKPYYLRLRYGPNDFRDEKYSDSNADIFLNENYIYSHAGLSRGLSEIKLYPGLVGKAGFMFDWGSEPDEVKAIEVGVMLNVYPQKVSLMANNPDQRIFTNFYLCLLLGSRK
ncbi:MAG: hypothetical protein R2798_06220 [Chitinophagales bacterium]|nr:hypothetical protein [Bacteroidota bacterium]MCB9043766.1 hypothetical protein [Chitinophagales bacterium]